MNYEHLDLGLIGFKMKLLELRHATATEPCPSKSLSPEQLGHLRPHRRASKGWQARWHRQDAG